jgi:hypothetical protein
MTDMQKRLSDLQRDVNQLKNKKFRPRKFDNTPRFNYERGQAYGQNYVSSIKSLQFDSQSNSII